MQVVDMLCHVVIILTEGHLRNPHTIFLYRGLIRTVAAWQHQVSHDPPALLADRPFMTQVCVNRSVEATDWSTANKPIFKAKKVKNSGQIVLHHPPICTGSGNEQFVFALHLLHLLICFQCHFHLICISHGLVIDTVHSVLMVCVQVIACL